MRFDAAVVAVFLLTALGIVGAAMALGRLVRPNRPDPIKNQTYECGERPIGSGWFSFNPRFYQLALLFLIFDVEIALTWPVAAVVRSWVAGGRGVVAVVEILLFLAVLVAALAWLWGRGDLDWIRELGTLPPPGKDGERGDDA
ncbi:MAG TPA: NADH-quinone oxidoreductase subunit A [Myxococcota bacterium]|nr:NADH-quinone oxidoreductase subunit A [Myxococcota bacterium]HQK50908.1 NADH-quinone oxidoreductase subunit A [Myxococcota bacterium]